MTENKNETKTEKISDIKKEDTVKVDPMTEVISTLVKSQTDQIASQSATIAELTKKLEEVAKVHNQNPVDSGIEQENKPKDGGEEVGDPVKAKNDVAPKPSEAQASIIAPAVKPAGSDSSGVQMENKADEPEKKEEKKEEPKEEKKEEKVEKMEEEHKEEKKKEEKKEDIKKNSPYEIVETVRPILKSREYTGETPTAYQMLKATANGFGENMSADQALTTMYLKIERGEFGNGQPGRDY